MFQTDQESSGKPAEDVIQTVSARECDGVVRVTIHGEAGDREVSVGKASELC